MRKNLSLMSLMFGLFVSMLSLTACSSDDDPSSNPLIGTWCWEGDHVEEITFNKDYTCTYYCSSNEETDTGKYKIYGNKVSIWWNSEKEYWEEEGPYIAKFSITGNKMSIMDEGGHVDSYTKK